MMSSERASVFDQGPDIDVSGFKPIKNAKPAAESDQVRAISETANFVSREPAKLKAPTTTREPRRHRPSRRASTRPKHNRRVPSPSGAR